MTRPATGDEKKHLSRIRDNLIEMRRCLRKSERARDLYYATVDAFKERGLAGPELDAAMKADDIAQKAVSDNIMFDRWTTKYAAVVEAEIEAFRAGIHANDWLKEN